MDRRTVRPVRGRALRGADPVAYALTGDRGHAEDLVQTSLTAAYLRWRRAAPDNPEAYMRRTLVNTNLKRFRRRRVTEILVAVPPERLAPGSPFGAVDDRDMLRRLLATLSPRDRTVLALRYSADLSEAETADLMDLSVGTVKSIASRALRRLRSGIQEREREEAVS